MVISHNIQALNTNRIANENISLHSESTEKVSSGYRINHAEDNPVGLAMSEKMRRQVKGLNQGIENAKAAINLCQVADGALSEVTEMLQRLNELAVKAENGTNLDLDRHYIQAEVEQLLTEIDRVADTTTFNEIPIFKGTEKTTPPVSPTPDDSSVIEGDIPFEDFSIADVNLGLRPFAPSSDANYLNLQAIVNNDTIANGRTYNLIFGSGSTSFSSFKLSYEGTDGNIVNDIVEFSSLQATDYQTGIDADGHSLWQRSFEYNPDENINIKITQLVTAIIPEDPSQEKKYNISYAFSNMSDNTNVALDFMFHADTAYNDDDYCEGYFINDGSGNGSRLDKFCMFTDGGAWASSLIGSATENITENLPDSFSIIDVDKALAFSEKVSFVAGSEPNAVSIGHYRRIHNWGYYEQLESNLGQNAIQEDLGFSLFWNQNIDAGSTTQVSFDYGIIASENDDNLTNVPINKSPAVIGKHPSHYGAKSLWIQAGSEKGSGLWLEIDEMNTEVLGIDGLDLTTIKGAANGNARVKEALHQLAISRSKIGAQQNRLEHTVVNEENIVEKVSASESLIRDTDLSEEMVRYTNLSVLLQMGQNMIAQADQRVEKLLTILQ